PNTLKKNNNNTPIPNFTTLCAINRVGLAGAPITNNRIINATMMEMTTVELISFTPFPCPTVITYAVKQRKRTEGIDYLYRIALIFRYRASLNKNRYF